MGKLKTPGELTYASCILLGLYLGYKVYLYLLQFGCLVSLLGLLFAARLMMGFSGLLGGFFSGCWTM